MSDLIEREYLLNIARQEEAYGYVSEHEILNAPNAETTGALDDAIQEYIKDGYILAEPNEYVKDGTLTVQMPTIKEAKAIDKIVVYADTYKQEYSLPKVGEWISVKKRLPKVDKPVLISAKNNYYKYVCVGKWVEKYSVEDEGEEFDFADYNEENDTYYYPEGWYECIYNWGDYSDVFISDEVIAWQLLPEPYEMERSE